MYIDKNAMNAAELLKEIKRIKDWFSERTLFQ